MPVLWGQFNANINLYSYFAFILLVNIILKKVPVKPAPKKNTRKQTQKTSVKKKVQMFFPLFYRYFLGAVLLRMFFGRLQLLILSTDKKKGKVQMFFSTVLQMFLAVLLRMLFLVDYDTFFKYR